MLVGVSICLAETAAKLMSQLGDVEGEGVGTPAGIDQDELAPTAWL